MLDLTTYFQPGMLNLPAFFLPFVLNAEEVAPSTSRELVRSIHVFYFLQMFLICTVKMLTEYSLCG